MAIVRRDDTVMNTIGTVVPGARVYYLTQPANTSALTPLATVYSNTTGTVATNPQVADGFGHAVAYLNDGQLYTIVYVYPNGTKVVYADQSIGGSGSSTPLTPFSGTPSGTKDGANTVFTFAVVATPVGVPMVWNNFPLIPNLGFTYSWASGTLTITYATAPLTTDDLSVSGYY